MPAGDERWSAGRPWVTDTRVIAPDTSRNWMGIAALVLGLVGGSVLALILGALGLRAAREGKATNRSLSIAGLVLGAAWGMVLIFASVAAVLSLNAAPGGSVAASGTGTVPRSDTVHTEGPTVPLTQVTIGDCYQSDRPSQAVDGSLVAVTGLAVVDCSATHDAEVYYVTTLDGSIGPGDPGYADAGFRRCSDDRATTHIDAAVQSRASVMLETYTPQEDGWGRGERYVVCGAVDYHAAFHASFTTP